MRLGAPLVFKGVKMDVSIIAVGTELLFGQVINTNAAFISDKLNRMGFNIMYHHVVGDNPVRLKKLVETSLMETDLIILTGGLGPTQDDLTKEIVAKAMGAELYFSRQCYDEIKSYFYERNRPMAENNKKQAYMPIGSTIFHNESGTAPAFALEKNGKCAICLPGPPREMKWLMQNGVVDFLKKFSSKEMYYKVIRTIGIGESDLETKLLPLIDNQNDPTIATYAKEGECTVRVASQRDSFLEAEEAVSEAIKSIDDIIGDYIYSYDDEELNEVVVKELLEKNILISSAESCTGGMFASSITDVSGASKVLNSSYVTYSDKSKEEILGVSHDTIAKFSVVSGEVAKEMAAGLLNKSKSDIAVSITGFAGPEADKGRECGNAFIGFATGKKLGNKNGYVEINTKRNDRKWNKNFFRLRMLLVVHRLIGRKIC